MRSTLFLSAVAIFFFWMMPAAAQTVSVALFENGSFHPSSVLKTGENHLSGGISVKMEKFQKNGLAEYCISVVNTNKNMPVRLRFRMAQECAADPGIYWDGFEEYQIGADKTAVIPDKNRYNFPLHAFHSGKQIIASGLAPWTVCSRFERSLQKHSDRSRLYFDIFLALAPQEKEKIGFVSMQIADGDAYTEAVEKVYVNYPAYFRPVDGADPRRYGVGGYFYSSDDSREYQSEEARRVNFSWEWYYNCYQKAGDIFPDNQFWDSAKGYKTERSHAACDTPGSVADWIEYNRKRIADGNVTAALHFYYLQQYCNSDLLKKFYQDSPWIGKDSKPMGAVHGWAEEGWANYAWPGAASTYGNALRKDLAQIWENFDIAGFALDMTLGDTPYYGKLVMQEKGKAFDADGRIFVAEGVAIAHNLDYTRNLPPKKDGRRAASITNEPFTYLPAFHGDGSMHEMPPYDRPELVAPRRMLVGQKPFSWWKGFRAESIFEWKKLSASEREEALTGLVDYVLMASFRFGAMPPVFFQKGFHDLVASQPLLEKLTRQGWRAASFAVIDGLEAEAATPFAIGNRVWLSRFGDGEKSFFALSAPDRAVFRGKLRIKGGKFGAAGAVYANVDGSPTANQVTAEETVVDIELSGHQVLVLQRVGSRPIGKYTETLAAEKSVADTCDWIDSFEFLNGARRLAAIAADPADTGELENELRCLRSYASYISSRRRVSARRLWDMGDFWHRHLLLDRDMPKTDLLSRYPVIFAIGSNARQAYFPTEKFSDRIVKKVIGNQTVIAFFPGKNSEKELLREFFRRLDKRYYFIGVITEPWAVDAGIHSKIFKRKLPARP